MKQISVKTQFLQLPYRIKLSIQHEKNDNWYAQTTRWKKAIYPCTLLLRSDKGRGGGWSRESKEIHATKFTLPFPSVGSKILEGNIFQSILWTQWHQESWTLWELEVINFTTLLWCGMLYQLFIWGGQKQILTHSTIDIKEWIYFSSFWFQVFIIKRLYLALTIRNNRSKQGILTEVQQDSENTDTTNEVNEESEDNVANLQFIRIILSCSPYTSILDTALCIKVLSGMLVISQNQ